MEKKLYTLSGQVVNTIDKRGIAGLVVEGWDNDKRYDDLVGSAVTDKDGRFAMHFDSSFFKDYYTDKDPDIYFRIFYGRTLLKSTEKDVLLNVTNTNTQVTIEVHKPRVPNNSAIFNRMSPAVKKEMYSLKKRDNEITKKLKDPKISAQFLENPVAALEAMNVAVSPQLKRRLNGNRALRESLQPRSVRLPNGQIITPTLNIRFTSSQEK